MEEPEYQWINDAHWANEEIVLDGELVRYQTALHNQSNTVAVKVISGEAGAPVLSLGTLARFFNYLSETDRFMPPKKLELFISGRGVVLLPDNISVLGNNLRRLEVTNTRITSQGFPREMVGLQELRRVVLSNNQRLLELPRFIDDYIHGVGEDGRLLFPHLLDIIAEDTGIAPRDVQHMYIVLDEMADMRAEEAEEEENEIIGGRRRKYRKSHRKSHRKSTRKTKKHSSNKTPNTPSKKRPNKNPRKSIKHNLKRRVSRNR